jgi:hypothetical protein
MRQGGEVEIVRVKVLATPRLLADLIEAALDRPPISPWTPGDSPAQVTIINSNRSGETHDGLTIVLGDRLADPVSVIADGERSSVGPTQLDQLHDLILGLARAHRTGGSDG